MKAHIERFTHHLSPEEVRGEITEDQITELLKIYRSLGSLLNSLTGNGPEAIKPIYAAIAKEQEKPEPNLALIYRSKNDLAGAYNIHSAALSNLKSADLPPKFFTYMEASGADIKTLSIDMLKAISEFKDQPVSNNLEKNSFRLPVWIENISKATAAIKSILNTPHAKRL